MKLRLLIAAGLLLAAFDTQPCDAQGPRQLTNQWNQHFAATRPWHGPYYDQNWGQPLAVIVPPTAHTRQTYSWGVSQNTTHPIYHQYQSAGRPSPGAAAPGRMWATPGWPSHTDQFGRYYVRGPW